MGMSDQENKILNDISAILNKAFKDSEANVTFHSLLVKKNCSTSLTVDSQLSISVSYV